MFISTQHHPILKAICQVNLGHPCLSFGFLTLCVSDKTHKSKWHRSVQAFLSTNRQNRSTEGNSHQQMTPTWKVTNQSPPLFIHQQSKLEASTPICFRLALTLTDIQIFVTGTAVACQKTPPPTEMCNRQPFKRMHQCPAIHICSYV